MQRFSKRRSQSREAGKINLAGSHQMETGLKVALFGPPHIPNRVVVTGPFITRIVTARTAGTGEADLEFFFVKQLPGQLDFCGTDVHKPAAIAERFCGLLDWSIALRSGANHCF